MEYEVSEFVVHPSYGVGQIKGIEEMDYLGAESRPFYVVSVDGATVWIPVEEEGKRIRPVTPKVDLAIYRDVLRESPTEFHKDRYKRRQEYRGRLKEASFRDLCEVVRDLTVYGREKSLNESDAATLRKISGNLYQEWALSSGISLAEAEKEIRALIGESHQV